MLAPWRNVFTVAYDVIMIKMWVHSIIKRINQCHWPVVFDQSVFNNNLCSRVCVDISVVLWYLLLWSKLHLFSYSKKLYRWFCYTFFYIFFGMVWSVLSQFICYFIFLWYRYSLYISDVICKSCCDPTFFSKHFL